jgi:hypothetical protein
MGKRSVARELTDIAAMRGSSGHGAGRDFLGRTEGERFIGNQEKSPSPATEADDAAHGEGDREWPPPIPALLPGRMDRRYGTGG